MILKHIKTEHREFDFYELTPEDIKNINNLVEEKYSTWEWNFGTSSPYNFSNRKKFLGGSIEVYLTVTKGIIHTAKLNGDFFGKYDVSDIEHALNGIKHAENTVRQALSIFKMDDYFANITIDNLISALL